MASSLGGATRPRRHGGLIVVAAATLALGPLTAGTPSIAALPNAAAGAQQLAAENGGRASDYLLVYEHADASAQVAWAAKFVDARTGELVAIELDGSGNLAASAELSTQADDRLEGLPALERKADGALLAAAEDAGSTEPLAVAVWLGADASDAEAAVAARHPEVTWIGTRPVVNDLATLRALRAELWEARRQTYAAAQASAEVAIERLGGRVAYASTSAPLLLVDLPAGSVSALAAEPSVSGLGLESVSRPTMSSAGPTVQADWTGGGGDQGTGVRVAVVEYHNVRTGGDLSGRVVRSYSTTGTLAYTGSGQLDHPTWVAGAVASHDSHWTGIAPGAYIVSASTGGYNPSLATDRAIIAAADWSVSPHGGDADIVNASFGQDTTIGAEEARRYFDSIVAEDGRTVVAAAGNYVTFGHWDVLSPGTGYNVLSVGGVDDRNTAGIGDDRVWFYPGSNGSNYRDPISAAWNPHGDFNKPDVSAPAVNVVTANGQGASGTSVASPITAGVVAQLMARQPSLGAWPEAIRAIMSASAFRRTPMPDGSFNADHEGAGTASALWANRILVPGGGTYGGYHLDEMDSAQTVSRQFTVRAGERVRVSLAWSSRTGGSNLDKTDELAADLDLRILLPGGGTVGSYSFDNSYETVDFVAPQSGTVTAQIVSDRFETSSQPYGLAWAIAGPFNDIEGSPFYNDIMWAWDAGITAGCATARYCPTATVAREQMASFLVRALGLPGGAPDRFTDDEGSIHEADINSLAAAAVTGGCAATLYCPTGRVTRAQMASFLVRALDLPRSGVDAFTDDEGSIHEADINALAASGITAGCGTGRYCPDGSVTRGEMAAFLHRAFGD